MNLNEQDVIEVLGRRLREEIVNKESLLRYAPTVELQQNLTRPHVKSVELIF